ncbi:MAG: XisI protein [Bacteroidetes bacterium]|nr:MAG: XisI protein [Bacteroidota bacterium]TAG86274.1 MAG: XisI protein [Bacteroidota bacterium]
MDTKYIKYNEIVCALMEDITEMTRKGEKEYIDTQLIIDKEKGHYLIYSIGWEKTKRSYGCFLHIEVKKNAKIFLHHNGTNLEIVDELMENGVEKMDIALAFQPYSVREISGFYVGQ